MLERYLRGVPENPAEERLRPSKPNSDAYVRVVEERDDM